MRLKNKKTGQIKEVEPITIGGFRSLAELNEEWEDVPEESKGIQCIYYVDHFDAAKIDGVIVGFGSKEEAEKAVEKLKAVKRLKEVNIDYKLSREYDDFTETMHANVSFSFNSYPMVGKDLDLLFGGEE